MTELATCWGLVGGSLLIAAPVIFLRIQEQSSLEDDINFSDETAQDLGIAMQEKGASDSKDNVYEGSQDGKDKDNGSYDHRDNVANEQEVVETVGQEGEQHDHADKGDKGATTA